VAQEVLYPFLTNKSRLRADAGELLSPIDYVPADTASWRLSMMRNGAVSDEHLQRVQCPVLAVASAEDLLLPSTEECARLKRLVPSCAKIILPECGHTPMLEEGVCIVEVMQRVGFVAPVVPPAEPEQREERREEGPAGVSAFNRREDGGASDATMDELHRQLGMWRAITSPKVLGSENLPALSDRRPILFVGNHTLFGFYDTPIILDELYIRGFKLRGLAHPAHFESPVGLGEVFERYGAVKASRMAAYKLLAAGESVLLYAPLPPSYSHTHTHFSDTRRMVGAPR